MGGRLGGGGGLGRPCFKLCLSGLGVIGIKQICDIMQDQWAQRRGLRFDEPGGTICCPEKGIFTLMRAVE